MEKFAVRLEVFELSVQIHIFRLKKKKKQTFNNIMNEK